MDWSSYPSRQPTADDVRMVRQTAQENAGGMMLAYVLGAWFTIGGIWLVTAGLRGGAVRSVPLILGILLLTGAVSVVVGLGRMRTRLLSAADDITAVVTYDGFIEAEYSDPERKRGKTYRIGKAELIVPSELYDSIPAFGFCKLTLAVCGNGTVFVLGVG